MTDFAVEQLLDDLAPALQEEPEAWADVLARAHALAGPSGHRIRRRLHPRRAPRRRFLVAAVALLAVVLVAAAAYALSRTVVDFGSAPKAPEKVVVDFERMDLGAPPGMASKVLPHETRRITSVVMDGEAHVLWVAPTAKGGFCEVWSGLLGDCRQERERGLDVSVGSTRDGTSAAVLAGSFFDGAGERIEVSFADGTSSEIPFVWVTEPIEAGFYLYRVPDANRVHGRRPVSVTLFDAAGDVLRRSAVTDVAATTPPPPPKPRSSSGRPLFDWRLGGRRLALWATPGPNGTTCMRAHLGASERTGCSPVGQAAPIALLGVAGPSPVTLCCEVGAAVTRVRADFQDGDRIELAPKHGYLLWPIPVRHYPAGHRLEHLVAYNAAGQVLAQREIPTGDYVYECAKPNPPKGLGCP